MKLAKLNAWWGIQRLVENRRTREQADGDTLQSVDLYAKVRRG
jgi:hypothetical protein